MVVGFTTCLSPLQMYNKKAKINDKHFDLSKSEEKFEEYK
jgi:hypothetical protein